MKPYDIALALSAATGVRLSDLRDGFGPAKYTRQIGIALAYTLCNQTASIREIGDVFGQCDSRYLRSTVATVERLTQLDPDYSATFSAFSAFVRDRALALSVLAERDGRTHVSAVLEVA